MDIFSHGLWGGIAFGRKKRSFFLLGVLFGMLPDLLSFGVHTAAIFLGFCPPVDWSKGHHPTMGDIPFFVHILYDISHSLVIFIIIFAMIWFIRKKPFIPFLAYGFAVALDIPTHSLRFFATPFLWPLSNYRFDGISWGHPFIFIPNVIFLVTAYIMWYFRKKSQ
jgi:hypothetical protein